MSKGTGVVACGGRELRDDPPMTALLRTRRFIWGAVIGVLILLSLGGYFSGRRYIDAATWVSHTFEVVSNVERTLARVHDLESSQRGFLLTGDAAFLESYRSAREELPAALSELRRLVDDNPRQIARVDQLKEWIQSKQAFADETIAARQADEDYLAPIRSGRGRELMSHISHLALEMRDAEQKMLVERTNKAAGAEQRTIVFSLVGFLLVLSVALLSLAMAQKDVRGLEALSQELSAAERKFRKLAENASDLVLLIDPNGRVSYVSPSVRRLLGYEPEEFMRLDALVVLPEPGWSEATAWVREMTESGSKMGTRTLRYRRKDGGERWFDVSANLLFDGPKSVPSVLLSARDIHERRLAQEALEVRAETFEQLSTTDGLTGLLNRRGFMERALEALMNTTGPRAVVFVDLDGLKGINDTLGHEAGDAAIVEAARLLRAVCRGADLVARLGGDEFAVFAGELTEVGYGKLRGRIEQALEERNAASGRAYQLAFSIGAAFYDPNLDDSLDALLKRADTIMYEEKRRRRELGARSV